MIDVDDAPQAAPSGRGSACSSLARSAARRRHCQSPAPGKLARAGFTVLELVVTLAVTVILLLGILATFDFNSRVSRVQTHVADMQQSLRIAQHDMVRFLRMTGRGGLPMADQAQNRHPPTGIAIEVQDNVGANTELVAGNALTRVVEGTDVLTVRGVFTTPLFFANSTDERPALRMGAGGGAPWGDLRIDRRSSRGVVQDLAPLRDIVDRRVPEALLIVSGDDDTVFTVVEVDPAASSYQMGVDPRTGRPVITEVDLRFRSDGALGSEYVRLSPGGVFPPRLRSVLYAGILEEYRFYVREDHLVPGDLATQIEPKLSRARFHPGTNVPYVDAANAYVDVADNVIDLQVALGFDSPNGGMTGEVIETDDGSVDDWMLNRAGEKDEAVWKPALPNPPLELHYVRLSTLARTDRIEFQYQAPLLPPRIENHATGWANTPDQRKFRRRLLQTVVDLRNLA